MANSYVGVYLRKKLTVSTVFSKTLKPSFLFSFRDLFGNFPRLQAPLPLRRKPTQTNVLTISKQRECTSWSVGLPNTQGNYVQRRQRKLPDPE